MKDIRIPEVTIKRLSSYSRYLNELSQKEITTVTSKQLAEEFGVKCTQIRKDINFFGQFGIRGIGYNVDDLHKHILKTLGLRTVWSIAIVGFGDLGSALCNYIGFKEHGFSIDSIFDIDPKKIGTVVNGIEIRPIDQIEKIMEIKQSKIGIISVPTASAQRTADLLVRSGIQAIMNFAPIALKIPPQIEIRNIDLTNNLEVLTYNLNKNAPKRKIQKQNIDSFN
ncbi:redox-sensing transcriptional repressor Rex [Dehalobacter sp. DCM]|uniref:redox-sensing transcriptional repressor Rex n=1 Tax=Dehalobacter sp. DCM TaxID=2907827 RepID=UPI003081434F|nr:redox-sensing transcriptional repressor Rex [Dehalobacter sp. DCM]